MTQIINTGFDNNNVGQATAMTVIFMLIITVIAIIQRAAVRQRGGV
jgi:multiple sugar transport system permease protein